MLRFAQRLVRPLGRAHEFGFRLASTQAKPVNFTALKPSLSVSGCETDQRFLTVKWSDLEAARYPLVWLRNNCQCDQCFHPVSLARLILARDMPLEPQLAQIRVDDQSGRLELNWEDGHKSSFDFQWLEARNFSEERRDELLRDLKQLYLRQAWGKGFQPPILDFEATVGSEKGLLHFIHLIKVYGFCIIDSAEGEHRPVDELGNKLGYLLNNAYGPVTEVRNKADPSNLAFTNHTLGLHTDLPFYSVPPGIQIMHCVQQTDDIKGGHNLFADSLFAGRRVRHEDPNAFRLLKEEKVLFWDYGSDYVPLIHLQAARPTFRVDENDEVVDIAYNNQVRDSRMVMDVDKVPDWYRATGLLEKVFMEEALQWRLLPGQIACFDNTRVLHGREGYMMTSLNARRHLKTVYALWDEVNSIYRRLKEKCGEPEVD